MRVAPYSERLVPTNGAVAAPVTTTPPSAVEQAHAQLREWLRDGTFPPGSMLSENDLAKRLGMSRTPVRAALRRLEADGWVTIYPQRGALVRTLSIDEAIAVSDARVVLESAHIDALSDDARAQLCSRLEDSIRQQIAELEQGSYEKLVPLTIDFHRAFVEAGDNPLLIDFYDRMRDRQSVMMLRTYEQVTGRWDEFIAEHRRLLDRAKEGNRAAFLAELRSHIIQNHGPLMGAL
ncbi:MAG: transcriptional regulator [Subtercola sp.]|nr:transcriptional regulator [Subtercola sp.]